jgi:hypothetical protein
MQYVHFKGLKLRVQPPSNIPLGWQQGIARCSHLGPLGEQLIPNCSAFQVYESNGSLFACACSSESQWMDVIFYLFNYDIVPLN